ncbi:MAG: hypothetical protein LUB61_01940, partial [Eggerthellaceae bacterium]|nr:hypothetical protein [Eggerthellaceae bacterium]
KDTDYKTYLSDALSLMKNPEGDTTAIQKSIIALTALTYDAAALPDGDSTYNAIEALGQSVDSDSLINAKLTALWAYSSGDYVVPDDAKMCEADLIDSVIADQQEDGGFSYYEDESDYTAMAINALQPYADTYANAEEAMNKALECLKGLELEDGSFQGYGGVSNSCSTAFAVIAKCAAGLDPAADWVSEDGTTPLEALMNFMDTDTYTFAYEAGDDPDEFSTEEAFRALVATENYEVRLTSETEEPIYNIYTQARLGTTMDLYGGATIPADDKDTTNPETPAAASAASSTLAQTGDNTDVLIGIVALVIAAGIVACVVSRRKIKAEDGSSK